MKTLTQWLTAATALIAFTALNTANAHTTSIGFVPGANAGEVTFWTGSYHNIAENGGVNEGSLTLVGADVVFGPIVTAFDITPVAVKPAGLVDGTNNCYWTTTNFSSLNCSVLSDPNLIGPVRLWQGVTFAGLSPGTYNFTCGATCGTSDVFRSLTGAGPNIFAQVTLTGKDIGGNVPEPGILALMSLGLIGLGIQRRKLNK